MNKSFSESDRRRILAFVAAFLWADFAPDGRRLAAAAKELGLRAEDAAVRRLLRAPPREEEVDPARLSARAHAATVVLCKQAIRGRRSLATFELLTLLEELGPQRTKSTADAGSPVAA
jgi:hypothetical protein